MKQKQFGLKLFALFVVAALCVVALPAAPAQAAPTYDPPVPTNACSGSGYMRTLTLTQSLPRMDDGFGGPYNLGFSLNYFGTSFTQVFISNNGYLTFGTGSSVFTPTGMPSLPYRTIAPFYGDVDTRTAGSPNSVIFDPVTVDGHPAFAVHYDMTRYFSNHSDKINDFMVIIIDRSDRAAGDWDFEYNYGQIQWETGDASGGVGGLGGTSAAIGYADGTPGTNDYQAPGSLIPGSFLDSNLTTGARHTALNSPNCGQWTFAVAGGNPPGATPPTPPPTMTALSPSHGPVTGGTTITLTGTNLSASNGTTITIGGTQATCSVNATGTQATCTTPAHVAGPVNVTVTTAGGTTTLSNSFTYDPVVVPATGFAPNRVTSLPAQGVSYADLGDLWLEIPALGVQMPIVGVPQTNGGWDVSWLGNDAGWLDGSAFPTWAGNSVLTGHVYDAFGKPGPFAGLNRLWWGSQVIVHAWGGQYVYEVRAVMQVAPGNTAAMLKHQELPWLTLVTCRGYDEASNSYKSRVLVRAVLMEVK